jgi:hypothetical protein
LSPHVNDLLVFPLQNRDRTVSKDDFIASIWGDRITSRIYPARKAVAIAPAAKADPHHPVRGHPFMGTRRTGRKRRVLRI